MLSILSAPLIADRLGWQIHRLNFPRSVKVLLAFALLLLTLAWMSGPVTKVRADNSDNDAGAVYVLTNEIVGNRVAVFNRAANGTLTPAGLVSTGGLGIGDQSDTEALGSQDALVLSTDNRWLFAVNGGSGDISVFAVRRDGLRLVNKVPSNGPRPISLTVRDSLLYVLNYNRQAKGDGNITGFTIGANGHLTPLPNSTRPLSAPDADPGDIQFSPNGKLLAVTEKATNRIVTYTVGSNGLASGPIVHAADSLFPFSLAFGKHGVLVIADDFLDAPGQAAASSYIASVDGSLRHVSGPVFSRQTAACWVVVTGNGKYAYVSNPGSDTITGYSINQDDSLSLLNANGVTAVTGPKVRDIALSNNNRYLYALNSVAGTVSAYQVRADGSLKSLGVFSEIPPIPAFSSNGLAAH